MKNNFEIININQIYNTRLINDPFPHALVKDVIFESYKQELIKNFPKDLHTSEKIGDKSYKMHHKEFINPKSQEIGKNLHNIWYQLYEEIMQEKYRSSISKLTKIDLDKASIGATFWEYDKDCFLSIHTDKKEKLVTHLIYLNEKWEGEGGELLLYDENKKVKSKIICEVENSPILITSEKSWHSVPSILTNKKRRSIQIVFWRE